MLPQERCESLHDRGVELRRIVGDLRERIDRTDTDVEPLVPQLIDGLAEALGYLTTLGNL